MCPCEQAATYPQYDISLAHRIQELSLQNAGLGQQLPLASAHDVGCVGVQAPRGAQALDLVPRRQAPVAPQDSVKYLEANMKQEFSKVNDLARFPRPCCIEHRACRVFWMDEACFYRACMRTWLSHTPPHFHMMAVRRDIVNPQQKGLPALEHTGCANQ